MQDADRPRAALLAMAVLASLSSLCFALSFPLSATAAGGWPLAFAWPCLLALAVAHAPSARSLAATVFLAFLPAFLAHEWWMHEVTVLGMPVLAAYLAAWMSVLALLLRTLRGSAARHDGAAATAGAGRVARWSPTRIQLPFVVAAPLALVATEFLRGDIVCSGYAWFFAAHPLAEWSAVAQVAALGGGWLLSALAAAVGGGCADGIVGAGRARLAWPALSAALLLAAALWGSMRLGAADAAGKGTGLAALVVQTDLPMSNKLAWVPEEQVRDFRGFCDLTREGARRARAAGVEPALAIWPETTVPGIGFEPESIRALVEGGYYPGDRYLQETRALAGEVDMPLLVGSSAYVGLRVEGSEFAWDRQHNSAYLVNDLGVIGRTDKIFLTPFGETMPVISRWDWLEARLLDLGATGMTFDLVEAEAPRRFSLDTGVRPSEERRRGAAAPGSPANPGEGAGARVEVGVPICFEITSPWASRRIAFEGGVRRAGVLVNMSNDGWFGPSEAGRRQHLQVAQVRAIELATPVIRCANTGISAEIDAFGRIRASLAPRVAGTFVATPEPAEGVPVSVRAGDLVAWSALGASAALVAVRLAAGRQGASRAATVAR